MKKLLLVVLIALLNTALYGQFEQNVLENNPPSLKWNQVNTPHFRIVFPRGFEEQGQRVANTMEHIRTAEAASMGVPPRRIPIILQNQSAVSNGFVSILPRRSEFYAMPSQDYNFTGTNDWLNLLMSHEYRHIVQYQHATTGFNKLLYYLFGATTLAGMAQAAAPDWFWEGDAVATETAFTPGGRGKIPNFSLVFKTNLLEGRTFNYHKQHLRSYKHNIPNEYVLGYHMISYLRKRTNDPDIWEKISGRSWRVPFIPFAFSNAIKKESGMYVTALYREMAQDLKQQWQKEFDGLTLTPFERVNIRKTTAYTDYLYPQVMNDGSVLVMKEGIGDIQQFVLLKNGKEHNVFTPGYINDSGMLSTVGSKIVWNEFGFHPRWGVKNYSLVKLFDQKTGKRKTLGSNRERFGSAALSPDGNKVVTVRTDTEYKTRVVVLDLVSGNMVKEYPNPQNDFYSMPRWSYDGTRIAILKTTTEGKTITIIDSETEHATDVFPVSLENFGHPLLVGEYLLFNSPVSGIDNIYALQLSTNKRFQVTASKYGAYNPFVTEDGKTIYYNDQTRDGLDVVRIPFDPASWRVFVPEEQKVESYQHLVEQEGHPDLFGTVPQRSFPVTKYSKWKGLFNPYTWGLNVNSDLTTATIGISSRDILSTTAIHLGYVFDINERTGAYRANVSYQGLFPVIDVDASISNRSVNEGDVEYYRTTSDDTVRAVGNLTFEWQEKTIEAGLRIPLNLTNSRFSTNILLGNYVGYTSVTDFINSIDGGGRRIPSAQRFYRNLIDNGDLFYNHFTLTAYRLMKQSRRDINPRWGQEVIANIYNAVTTLDVPGLGRRRFGDFDGRQISVYGLGYFPGLFKHHSLWGYLSYQRTLIANNAENNNYIFRNRIPLPRGQSVNRFPEYYGLSANYTLPIWYPDVAVGPVLNIQRLRANMFFDYGFGQSVAAGSSQSFSSVGIEAKLDINILRFFPQFDIGVRYTKGLLPATSRFELLIGTFNF
jgi:hypothetical protein